MSSREADRRYRPAWDTLFARIVVLITIVSTIMGSTWALARELDDIDGTANSAVTQAETNCRGVALLTVSLRLIVKELVDNPSDRRFAFAVLQPLNCNGDR